MNSKDEKMVAATNSFLGFQGVASTRYFDDVAKTTKLFSDFVLEKCFCLAA